MDFPEMFSTLLDEPIKGEASNCGAQKMGTTSGTAAATAEGGSPSVLNGQAVLNGSPVEVAANVDAPNPPLLGRKAPQYVRQQEMAWHRIALEYAAQGYTAKEIAGMLGCSPTAVQDILRQPQYQQTQVNLISKEVNRDKQVVEHIRENVLMAVETLSDIAKDAKMKPADRIAAARELLNRRYGMPNQPINRNTDVDLNKLSDGELAQMLVNGGTTTSTRLA